MKTNVWITARAPVFATIMMVILLSQVEAWAGAPHLKH